MVGDETSEDHDISDVDDHDNDISGDSEPGAEPGAGEVGHPDVGDADSADDAGSPDDADLKQVVSVYARRRVLVALGFGAANLAVGGFLGRGRSTVEAVPTTTTEVATPPAGPTRVASKIAVADPPELANAVAAPGPGHRHQLVIANGRVIDPATGFDEVAHLGIDDGVIVSLSIEPLVGEQTIDSTGRVVAPGFIDLLSYEPNSFGVWRKLADGVTSNLAMHGISNYARPFFARYEEKSPIHFGGAFSHNFIRAALLGADIGDELEDPQLAELGDAAVEAMADGMAGLSFSPEYSPGTTFDEMVHLAELAVEAGHVGFFHVRHSDPDEPGTSIDAVIEVLEIARRTGLSVHIEHLASTGGTHVMPEVLEKLNDARSNGIDVTACVYPYDFWATFLASSRFAPGWRERYRIDYDDLQIAGTDQTLTADTFETAKAENKLVAALDSIPEDDVRLALAEPWMMVASDAILEPGLNNHPRASGTFARTIRRYSTESNLLELSDALAKMTILPARRLEGMIPAMARKGRMQRGADADVVVFDPAKISDRATVTEPGLTSVGIDHVIVDGRVALESGVANTEILAGTPLKSVATRSNTSGR